MDTSIKSARAGEYRRLRWQNLKPNEIHNILSRYVGGHEFFFPVMHETTSDSLV